MSNRLAASTRTFILDEHAKDLADALMANEIDVAGLRTAADSLLKMLFHDGQSTESLASAQTRIASQYRQQMDSLDAKFGAGSPESLAFRDAVLSFESAAGLGTRHTPATRTRQSLRTTTTAASPASDRFCRSS